VDLNGLLSDFIDETLGATGAYGLSTLAARGPTAEAAAVIRLRLALYRALIDDGWQPPSDLADEVARDERLLLERDAEETLPIADSRAEDYAAIRARASRIRAEARETSSSAADFRSELQRIRIENDQLHEAIESRAIIEQAKGIAMERYDIPVAAAWAWLVRTSQQRNIKLRALAQEIVAAAGHKEPTGGSAASARPVAKPSTAPAPRTDQSTV